MYKIIAEIIQIYNSVARISGLIGLKNPISYVSCNLPLGII